jgi:peptidoglycan/LPS O-acetylase OafA/YrhL
MIRAGGGEDRNLDVLRAIAVLLVLFDHVAFYSGAPEIVKGPFFLLGHAGVVIFFVHTSLVLMRSLERTQARGLKGWLRARDFYMRRAFRIYPLAITTVVAVIAFHLPSGPRDSVFIPPTPKELVANLLLLQNSFGARSVIGPLWSLPIEIEMYVVLPILFVLVGRADWRRLIVYTVTAVALAGVYLIMGDLLPGLWRLSVFQYLPCFVAGVVAFRAVQLLRPRLPAWIWPVIVLTIVIGNALIPRDDGSAGPIRDWLVALMVASFIPLVTELGPSLFTRSAHQVAKYSYGIYLSHVPVLDVAGIFMRNELLWLRIVTGLVGIVVVPILLYHAIEEPMIALGTRVAARLSHRHVRAATLASTAPAP